MTKTSRDDRKKLRLARKRLRFERKREKIAARNRAPKYIFCLACAAAGLVSFAFWLSVTMQLYAGYKYQTGASRLRVPTLSGPKYIRIEIGYQGHEPEKIMLSNGGSEIYAGDLDVSRDGSGKKIVVGYDAAEASDGYELVIWPGDNLELEYRITLEPSYRYMKYKLDLYSDDEGDLWLDAACSFERLPGNIAFSVRGRGAGTFSVIEIDMPQDVLYELNVSEIARRKNIDLGKCAALSISFAPGDAGSGLAVQRENIEIAPGEWPGYDPGSGRSYSLSDTDRYAPAGIGR